MSRNHKASSRVSPSQPSSSHRQDDDSNSKDPKTVRFDERAYKPANIPTVKVTPASQPNIKASPSSHKPVGHNERTVVEGMATKKPGDSSKYLTEHKPSSHQTSSHKPVGHNERTAVEGMASKSAVHKSANETKNPTEHKPSTKKPLGNADRTVVEGMASKSVVHKSKNTSKYLTENKPATKKPVGNADRTVVEGMASKSVPASKPQNTKPAASSSKTQASTKPPPTQTPKKTQQQSPTKSLAPPNVKSMYTTPHDKTMASRQTIIETLSPADRAEQEKWASKQISMNKACPDSFEWKRIDDGYHCKGEHHLMTDELVQEGKCGVFLIGGDIWKERWGPYYESREETRGLWWYAGPEPRPRASTPFIGETDERGRKWLREVWRGGSKRG